jgi:hypothetical protein
MADLNYPLPETLARLLTLPFLPSKCSLQGPLPSRLLPENVKARMLLVVPSVWPGNWSRTLREEHRLRVFQNRIFGQKRDEVTGGWRKLFNEELRDLYPSPSIIRMIRSRRMRWEGHVLRMEEKLNA